MKAEEIEKTFVHNFILKEQRERSLWLLNHKKKRDHFLNNFNHNWNKMIASKYITELKTKSDVETFQEIKSILKIKDTDLCYVISYTKFDRQFIEFENAFKKSQENGFASLIISENGKSFYLKTEQEIGTSVKFIGIK